MVHRFVKRSPCVDIATSAFDILGDLSDFSAGRAFEQHVFVKVGESCFFFGFIGASNADPCLDSDNRCGLCGGQDHA